MSSWLLYSSSDSLAYSICIYLLIASKDAERRTRECYLWTMNTFPLYFSFPLCPNVFHSNTISKGKTTQKRQPLKQNCEEQHTKNGTEENNRNIVVYISPQQKQTGWVAFFFLVLLFDLVHFVCMGVLVSRIYACLVFFFSYYYRGVIICSACESALFHASRCKMIFCCCFFYHFFYFSRLPLVISLTAHFFPRQP